MVNIKENTDAVRAKIEEAAKKAGRCASEIKLMGVSKFHPFEAMREAAQYVDLLGENRVQEAASKRLLWKEAPFDAPWHLIGQLQKNKARRALETFDLIESVDSFELASLLNRILEETGRKFPVYLEINMSHDENKSGAEAENAPEMLEKIMENCPRLSVEGLMTMAPLNGDEKAVRRAFSGLRTLAEELSTRSGLQLPVLSMGMSGDFEYAIEEGSTLVRVGTAIFGEREY